MEDTEMAKNEDYNRLIRSSRWKRLRARKLTRNPLCEDCEERGRTALATEVHHVRPVEDAAGRREMESLMFDPHNLRSLCHDCHIRTHTELGRNSKERVRQRNESRLEGFKRRFLDT